MNFEEAIYILDINRNNLSEHMIKKAYYKKALQWHPDKNKTKGSVEMFKKVNEAYEYLCLRENIEKHSNINVNKKHENKSSYEILIISFLQNIVKDLKNGYIKVALKNFDNFDKSLVYSLYEHLLKYNDIFSIDKEILEELREKIKENYKDYTLIELNPTINNLLNSDIYKLEHNNETFYVPLWHKEVEFCSNYDKLVVRCIPDLPKDTFIDDDNTIHKMVVLKCSDILDKNEININLGEKIIKINILDLKFKKYQTRIIRNIGVSKINTKDILSCYLRSHVVLHIKLI